ncbi:protein FAR-RED IMPAIRED RESPONSE 1-like [Arachis stenosperma]|uniref:protein FAR-RED IMPAIRED RESPONSE 1-like n=1 Tax=Arachis stenosperma TaxID=217475 RepID=UPI0025AC3E97|nr:protein FAR-RED IMPAIRED RESPONSE 1-like [Arachis stenosperma]
MGGNAPKGILTDQCASIQRAIELCMPTIIHRWCIWHIMKKIPRKLNGYKGHNKIEQEIRHVVWNSYTKEVFDRNWIDFLRKYGLGGNKWLSELYEDRHIWIPVYLDNHFWARMRSTQRSETIEAQFQHVYTHEKFKEVQAQLRGKVNCITRSMHSTLGFTTYEVIEQVFNSTFNKVVVAYDTVSGDVKCHCLLFESRGILCHHSLSVLSFEQVDNVAPKYILERWSKNIKRRYTHIKSSQDEPLLEPRSKRFDELVFRSHNICEFASESEELIRILHRAFDKVMAEMEEYQRRSKGKRKKGVLVRLGVAITVGIEQERKSERKGRNRDSERKRQNRGEEGRDVLTLPKLPSKSRLSKLPPEKGRDVLPS